MNKPEIYKLGELISASPKMRDVFSTVERIANFKTTVILLGESGTGKELIARAIHEQSDRRKRKFVGINCGAIPENLLESELFGHRRGAFTDATKDKKGLFEEANGGTILLDEIGELPIHLQAKLLRVLQEGEIRPVGSGESIPIDVRIIAATLRDIESDIIEGRFRDDLYYRLNVASITLPPLRERREDILPLATYFLERNAKQLKLKVTAISEEAKKLLTEYSWPGNVRELENCIERSMIMSEGATITVESLPKAVRNQFIDQNQSPFLTLTDEDLSIKTHTKTLERELIIRALAKTKGNRTQAAKLLEISHRALLYKLKDYNLNCDE